MKRFIDLNDSEVQSRIVKVVMAICAAFVILALLVGCSNSNVTPYQYGYGVACDQNGHISEIKLDSMGSITHIQDFTPQGQTCAIQSDGTIVIRNVIGKKQ
jgi:hypothetical protein